MASNFKNPPTFDGSETSYSTWKNELSIWRMVTDLPEEKQALAVTLSFSGSAKKTALELKAEDLAKKEGLDTLLKHLDGVFKRDDKDCAYEAYQNFENFRRSASTSMADYIIQFEQHYNRLSGYKMVLPDGILAFKLLDNAGLSAQERKLALTASTDLTFSSMKSALKRIFCENSCGEIASGYKSEPIRVKEEVFMSQHRFGSKSRKSEVYLKGTNPLNRFGKRSRCMICQCFSLGQGLP